MYLAKNINPAEVIAAADKNRKARWSIDVSSGDKEKDGVYFEECTFSGKGFTRRRESREKVFISIKELENISKRLKTN